MNPFSGANIFYKNDIGAEHTMPTDFFGNPGSTVRVRESSVRGGNRRLIGELRLSQWSLRGSESWRPPQINQMVSRRHGI
jgi:hypothetical protein